MRYTSLLAAHAGETNDVELGLRAAVSLFHDLRYPYWHARTQHDLGTWLAKTGRSPEAEALHGEARTTYQQLGIDATRNTPES